MTITFSLLYCILIWIFNIGFNTKCETDYELIVERLENIPGKTETLLDFSQLKVIKTDGSYVLDGEVDNKDDIDNTFSADLITSYSSLRNSQFVKLPYQIKKEPGCDFIIRLYQSYLEESLQGRSNFAPSGCPVAKELYYFREIAVNYSSFPYHIPRGMLKAEIKLYRQGNLIGGTKFFANIIDKN